MVHTLKAIAGVELGSEDPLRTTRVSYAVIPVDGSKGLKTATAGSMSFNISEHASCIPQTA